MAKYIKCPECGERMVLRVTKKYRYPNGEPRKFFGCSKYPQCTASHGADPDGNPLGIPANAETKQARIEAHRFIDTLGYKNKENRGKIYKLVGIILGVSPRDAHISRLTVTQCRTLIERLNNKGSHDISNLEQVR